MAYSLHDKPVHTWPNGKEEEGAKNSAKRLNESF